MRRRSVRLSAGGAGFRPAASSLAKTKLSIGLLSAEYSALSFGTAGRRIGWNDQWAFARARRSNAPPGPLAAAASSGHGAPPFTQAVSVAMSASASLPFWGILMSP